MSLDVRGGAGGVTARFQDMQSFADVLDDAGDGVRGWADDTAAVAFDDSVLAATLLCPAEVAAVEVAVGVASLSLVTVSTGFEASAVVIRLSVETYVFLDEAKRAAFEALHQAGGFALGLALPGIVVVGGVALLANPALTATLVASIAANPEGALAAVQQTLFDNPWLTEELTQALPWMVQGTAFSLSAVLGPAGLFLPGLLSGGQWPTTDYEDAVAGLVTLGGHGGAFLDEGDFRVVEADTDLAFAPRSVEDIFLQQGELTRGDHSNDGQIQVVRVGGPPPSWIVQVPGTQEWSPTRTDNPVDLTTNVHLMAGDQTVLQAQIDAAMQAAGVDPGDPVMLTGHSQGGIAAATMAADPAFTSRYNVTSVVTAGSPIARIDIPDTVSVLSLEHNEDVVPMLEGRENPDRPNWVTVESDAGAIVETRDLTEAHGTRTYAGTGELVDQSDDPSLVAWREQNAGFFTGEAEPLRFQIEPVGPGSGSGAGGSGSTGSAPRLGGGR